MIFISTHFPFAKLPTLLAFLLYGMCTYSCVLKPYIIKFFSFFRGKGTGHGTSLKNISRYFPVLSIQLYSTQTSYYYSYSLLKTRLTFQFHSTFFSHHVLLQDTFLTSFFEIYLWKEKLIHPCSWILNSILCMKDFHCKIFKKILPHFNSLCNSIFKEHSTLSCSQLRF